MTLASWLAATALGQVDPACADIAAAGPPGDYDEQTQQDFLQNYYALSSTLSPVHGPLPHEPGHGALGIELAVLPPLGCERRLVLAYTKTENTNKSPVIPRPRATVALPGVLGERVVPYVGFALVPPVPVSGVRNTIVSGEVGFGVDLGRLQLGARAHGTVHKTVGEVATPFTPEEPAVDDLFVATSLGGDGLVGVALGPVVPYASVGFTDVSTFFYVGDDGAVSNNLHPYAGLVASLGVDALVGRLRLGGELYAAPGGVSRPDPEAPLVRPVSRYGRLVTARLRVGLEL